MRKALVQVHLWLGLVLGLLWALQGLTGAMLVFHRDIDRWSRPPAEAGPLASLDRIAADTEARTGAPVRMITIAGPGGEWLSVHYPEANGTGELLIDSRTGRLVAERDFDPDTPFAGSGWRWLYLLHESLLLHDEGETLIGISGLLLVTALATGLWIGWPRRRQWRPAFDWQRWRTTRSRLFGWHRMAGILAGSLLLVTVPGGIWMIFAAELRPVVARAVPHELPYKAAPVAALGSTISPDAALARARSVFPGAAFVRLTPPTPGAPVYAVRLRQATETRAWSGVTTVTLDARSGRLLHVYDPLNAPLSNRLADAAFSVHSGEIAGLGGRLLIMLGGLSLPALYVTGLWAWWRKRRRRHLLPPAPLSVAMTPSSPSSVP